MGEWMSSKWGRSFIVLCVAITLGLIVSAQGQEVPFVLTVADDMNPHKVTSGVWIRVTQRNISDHDVFCGGMRASGVDMSYQYVVRDSQGHALEMRTGIYGAPAEFFKCVLPPGKTASQEELISALFDLSPGVYTIQVSMEISNQKSDGVVKSNTIKITIDP